MKKLNLIFIINIILFKNINNFTNFFSLKKKEKNKIKKNNNYTSFFLNSSIQNINDSYFDKIINNNNYSFVILFTVKRCKICNKIITLIENIQNYYLLKNNKIKFFKIDCFYNEWTSMRFNIDLIPKIIYIENNTYSLMKEELNFDNILTFIETKNKTKKLIPYPLNYFSLFNKFMNAFFEILNNKLISKGIPWNKYFSIIILLIIILILGFFEWYIFKCCSFWGNKKEFNSKILNYKKPKKITHNKRYILNHYKPSPKPHFNLGSPKRKQKLD